MAKLVACKLFDSERDCNGRPDAKVAKFNEEQVFEMRRCQMPHLKRPSRQFQKMRPIICLIQCKMGENVGVRQSIGSERLAKQKVCPPFVIGSTLVQWPEA